MSVPAPTRLDTRAQRRLRTRSGSRSRLIAVLAATGLLLAACAGDAGGDSSPDADTVADEVEDGAGADEVEDEAGADDSDADADADAAGDAAGERTVTHAMGETDVPAEPERVVVLDSSHLDAALSLGIEPVAAVQSDVDEGLPEYLGERTEGIEVVGTITEPDLERIAAARPDLILSARVRHEEIYDQLSQIAPTVFTESSGTAFKEGLAVVADALGRTTELEEALGDYEQRAREVGEAVGADGTTATVVRFLPGETRLYGPDTFSGTVLTDLGFDLGDKGFDDDPYSMAMISPEQAELADGDVIFTTTYGDPEESTASEMAPLLETLDAEIHPVDDREWMLGIGLIGAELILDDVEQLLGER